MMIVKTHLKPAPPLGDDRWIKITLVALDRHIAFLDHVAIDVRLKHGTAIARAEIIRALIDAAIQSGADLTEASSASMITEILKRRWE